LFTGGAGRAFAVGVGEFVVGGVGVGVSGAGDPLPHPDEMTSRPPRKTQLRDISELRISRCRGGRWSID
jgi:hypothetical protein